MTIDNLSTAELTIIDHLARAYDTFIKLPVEHPCDQREFCEAIHKAQYLVMARPVRRKLNETPD
jgi:hypothetical protein